MEATEEAVGSGGGAVGGAVGGGGGRGTVAETTLCVTEEALPVAEVVMGGRGAGPGGMGGTGGSGGMGGGVAGTPTERASRALCIWCDRSAPMMSITLRGERHDPLPPFACRCDFRYCNVA